MLLSTVMSAPSYDRRYYRNRRDAGRQLAARLRAVWNAQNATLVLGLARGGVPVAFEVAEGLGLPLDVLIIRKLGLPSHRELAMGAIASGGVRVLNEEVLRYMTVPDEVVEEVAAVEQRELERRQNPAVAWLPRQTKSSVSTRSRTSAP